MEKIKEKADFLRYDYAVNLEQIQPDATALWGKMNPHQMIEHMSDYIRVSSGKALLPVVTPEEHMPRMHAFLTSEKPFRENTPNSLMPDTPAAVKHATINAAIDELKMEIEDLFRIFEKDPSKKVTHPFFGTLDYDMNIQLLHKHATHHLRQFGINAQ